MTKPNMQANRAAAIGSRPDTPAGLLVLLAGAEARGKDLLIATARRRYAGDPRLEFPARLQTRASVHDSEHIGVPRRVFRDIEANRGFAVAWMGAGARYGLTAGALEALEAGRIVVLAIPQDAVGSFKDLWPNVEVVALACDVDAARPRPRTDAAHGARPPQGGAVRHSGDIAEAVRRFHRVLDDITCRQFTTTGERG
jgi:ribose 1,5-bisphosphokinase PhnN